VKCHPDSSCYGCIREKAAEDPTGLCTKALRDRIVELEAELRSAHATVQRQRKELAALNRVTGGGYAAAVDKVRELTALLEIRKSMSFDPKLGDRDYATRCLMMLQRATCGYRSSKYPMKRVICDCKYGIGMLDEPPTFSSEQNGCCELSMLELIIVAFFLSVVCNRNTQANTQ